MRKTVLIALILALTATAADARRRHHHRGHYYLRAAPVMMVPPAAEEFAREPRGRIEASNIVPRDWQLQPPDPNWQGRRYLAPDGSAWLALYSTNAANDAIKQKQVELGNLRAQCQAQMLEHFEEVSRAMPQEQGARYLAEMKRLTLGSHQQIENSMSGTAAQAHGNH